VGGDYLAPYHFLPFRGTIRIMTNTIVGIRFQNIGKSYHFRAEHVPDIRAGDFVIVETSRGQQLGEVIEILNETDVTPKNHLKPINRRATPRDLVLRQVLEYKEKEAIEACRSKVKELKIKGVKIVAAEYTFDGKRLTFMYNSEGDEKVDLSSLMKELKGLFRRIRIDMRQIGPRDVAKIIGGMGVCGMGVRCCAKFLTEFQPISIRMAKNQGVSLAPTEITGMCGRLRCCLAYENEGYVEARKTLPHERQRIDTPSGEGKVVSVSPLSRSVTVYLEEVGLKVFTMNELEGETSPGEEDEPLPVVGDIQQDIPVEEQKFKTKGSKRQSKRRPMRRKKKRS